MRSYIKGIVIIVFYVIFTRTVFITMVFFPNIYIALTLPTIISVCSAILFLYFFENENLFSFAGVIKNKKQKTEEVLLQKFIRFGSVGAVIIIGSIAGPLFCALTTHLLLADRKYKYWLAVLVSGVSVFISMCLARGVFHLIFKLVR